MNDKNNPLLSVRNLTIHYITDDGIIKAVNDLSFDLEKGKTLGLVGETGAGKTTTALGIMNLVPDPPGKIIRGEILVKGRDVLKLNKNELKKYRGKVASMILQDPMTALNPLISVGEQVAEVLRLHDKLSRADSYIKAAQMLELVGIPGDRMNDYPYQFSGGMKQRVVIAIALACNPQLLIADEPTTALDVTIQAQILSLIRDLIKKYGTSTVLITHDLGLVTEICDKVAIMYAGRIVEMGDMEAVYENTGHPYTRGLFGSLPNLSVKVHRLNPIEGFMPDPTDLPGGCAFHPRCPNKIPECEIRPPAYREVGPGHFVRCILCE
ncbi:MAG TPA: ABC transporter ATP-binding protein [Sedimentibacter sp.]|nr:ABC transporter ATP-binding protein [Sedimentibacter sp.]HOW22261.1 ABC transporter ATP-binding protein [Sedimentibacter sp.]HRC80389.1 ABC transporter ATP-binding protein [Sedimentibacter sp.]